jgi:hypothetical protein
VDSEQVPNFLIICPFRFRLLRRVRFFRVVAGPGEHVAPDFRPRRDDALVALIALICCSNRSAFALTKASRSLLVISHVIPDQHFLIFVVEGAIFSDNPNSFLCFSPVQTLLAPPRSAFFEMFQMIDMIRDHCAAPLTPFVTITLGHNSERALTTCRTSSR